jgi:uncharacterized RDD family membrane protein YckC
MKNTTYYLDEKLLATSGARFLNYIIDVIFYVLIMFLFGFIFTVIMSLLGFTDIVFWMQNISDLQSNLIAILILIIYYTISEGLLGRSFAKFITGTIVVDENGEKPSFGILFQRTLCRLIPFDAFSFLGSSARGWHDSISDTYVVDKKGLEESLRLFHEVEQIGELS